MLFNYFLFVNEEAVLHTSVSLLVYIDVLLKGAIEGSLTSFQQGAC